MRGDMKRIFFLRHGETDWNVQGRFQGIENISLNEHGLQQAADCGRRLKEAGVTFDCVISSPLDRAYQTAKAVAEQLGITEIQKDQRLIERDFGAVSGRKREERETMLASGIDLKMEEESKVAERMQQIMEEFCDKEYERILMVSHGASIRALLGLYSEAGSEPATAVQGNACFTTMIYKDGKFEIEAYDQKPEELV